MRHAREWSTWRKSNSLHCVGGAGHKQYTTGAYPKLSNITRPGNIAGSGKMVGAGNFEIPTSCSQGRHSSSELHPENQKAPISLSRSRAGMRYKLDYALCIRYRISRVITRLRTFDDCYRRWLHGPEMECLFHWTSSEWHGWNKFVKRKVWQGRRDSRPQDCWVWSPALILI